MQQKNRSHHEEELLDHAKKEARMDESFVQSIIQREKFKQIVPGLSIGGIQNDHLLSSKFSCHYDLDHLNDVPRHEQHLITGFGPTNAPTGGTLSMILRALFFHKYSGIESTIIISNLGAFDSRNISLEKITYYSHRFFHFIRLLGYTGGLRFHNDAKMLTASAMTAKVLTLQDFFQNEEATADLYRTLGIQGKDFPTLVDANFTVADILLPVLHQQKKRVLVFVGIEEYYFPKLANVALHRFATHFPHIFAPHEARVSGVFGRLITGLNGYPKMSKSIPDSSINLEDDAEAIKRKILQTRQEDEPIILQMMQIVSDWDTKKIESAQDRFYEGGTAWVEVKKEYLEYFLNIKSLWDATAKNIPPFKLSKLFDESALQK